MTEPRPLQRTPSAPDSDGRRNRPDGAALFILILPCAALVLTSSFDVVPGVAPYNGKRLVETLVFLSIISLVMIFPRPRSAFFDQVQKVPTLIIAAFSLAFALAVWSSLRFSPPGYSLAEVGILLALLIAALCIAASRRVLGTLFDRIALSAIMLLGVAVATQEFMGLLANWNLDREFSYDQMLVRFAHPRFYNQLQTWSIPLLAAIPMVFKPTARSRALAVILIAIQWYIVLATGGRGTTVSLIFSMCLFAAITYRRARRWAGLQLAGFLIGCLLFGGVSLTHTSLAPEGGEFLEQSVQRPMLHTTGRSYMWAVAWNQAKDNPVLGIGPGRFVCESPAKLAAHPHNFVIQLVSEWGFPATLLILLAGVWLAGRLVMGVVRAAESDPPKGQPAVVLLASSIFAAAIHANLSGVLMTPASQMLGCLILGWTMGLNRGGSPSEVKIRSHGGTTLKVAGVGLAGIASGLLLVFFSISELRNMEERLSGLMTAAPDLPRYWQAGLICEYAYPERGDR